MARERDYELGIVLAPETPDEQARANVERITNAVTSQGGVVVRINAWGRRRLAYPIEHYRDGLYYFFDLQLPPTSVVEIERLIGVNEDIIRHLMKARDPRVIGDERKRRRQARLSDRALDGLFQGSAVGRSALRRHARIAATGGAVSAACASRPCSSRLQPTSRRWVAAAPTSGSVGAGRPTG